MTDGNSLIEKISNFKAKGLVKLITPVKTGVQIIFNHLKRLDSGHSAGSRS